MDVRGGLGGGSSLYMQQHMVWLLAPSTLMQGLALFEKVTRSQTIHAEVVCFQRGCHPVMGKGFELGTSMQGVIVCLRGHNGQLLSQ